MIFLMMSRPETLCASNFRIIRSWKVGVNALIENLRCCEVFRHYDIEDNTSSLAKMLEVIVKLQ